MMRLVECESVYWERIIGGEEGKKMEGWIWRVEDWSVVGW